ncbi:MAG TPA: hypothetical protein VMT86_16845 [Bryobacteraceae bacterium]|nr:hypothetical protein [Bryobacteraceae bacterium]
MKLSGAVFVVFLAVAPLTAQYSSVGGFGNVVFPGLGHAPAGNPWGNVVHPGSPAAPAAATGAYASARRGGSTAGGYSYGGGHGRYRGTGIYAYPVFIGGYGYGYGYDSGSAPAPDDGGGNQPGAPPVIINQYFPQVAPDQAPAPDASSGSNYHSYQAPSNDDTAPPADVSYYLIAFKDHTIYSAVAYYTEGDTLHYFTSGNVHNQVSLSLVDRDLTAKLNRDRNVEVKLP